MGSCESDQNDFCKSRNMRKRSSIFEPMKTFETEIEEFDYPSWLLASKIEEKEDNLNELKKISENLKNEEGVDSYLEEINENFETFDDYLQVILKPLPENICKIKLEEGFSQYLITRNLDKEKLVRCFMESSKDDLIKQTNYIWQNLQLEEEITKDNFFKFYKEFLKNADQLKIFHRTMLLDTSNEKIKSFTTCEDVLLAIINFYTRASNSEKINQALSSKDPILLKRMALYLNYIVYNSKQKDKVLIGKEFDLKDNRYVYRKIVMKKNLINFYRENDYIFFTNFTSTSKGKSCFSFRNHDQDEIRVEFFIKLLSLKNQQKNGFYTGVLIEDVSSYKREEEVLVMPYQIFLVKEIRNGPTDYYQIYLEEQDDKDLIFQIIQPKNQKETKKSGKSFKSSFLNLETIKKSLNEKIEKTAEEKEKLLSDQKKEEEKTIKLESDFLLKTLPLPSFESCIKNVKLKQFMEGKFEDLIADPKSKFNLHIFDEFEFKNYFVSQTLHLYESASTELNTTSEEQKILTNPSFFNELPVEGNICLNFIYIILNKITESLGYKMFYCSSENINLHEDLRENYIYQVLSMTSKRRTIKLSFQEKLRNLDEIASKLKDALKEQSENSKNYMKANFYMMEYDILNIYCETNIQNENMGLFLKDPLAKLQLQLIKFNEISKNKKFLFHRDMFSLTGNKDFSTEKMKIDKRGEKFYCLPVDYKRLSLAVKHGSWLSMEYQTDEWPCAYLYFDEIDFDMEAGGKINVNPLTNDEYHIISKNGLQCSNNLEVFERLTPVRIVEIFDKKFSVAIQCRIRPEALQQEKKDTEYRHIFVLDRFKSNILRPYGILVREIK